MRKHSRTTRDSAKKFPRLSLTSVVVAAIILAIAVVTVVSRQNANGQEPTEQERSSTVGKKKKKLVTVEMGGQQVQVDSETGQIEKLTPEEAQRMAAALRQLVNKSAKDLDEIHHTDGSVSVDLKGRFQNVTVAKVDEDGNIVQSCVDNPKAAGAFFGIDPKQIENKNETPNRPAPLTPATNRN